LSDSQGPAFGASRPKVYITSLHLKHGGVEMMVSALANALVRRDFPVEILCTYRLGEPAYSLEAAVKVTYLTQDQPNRAAFEEARQQKRWGAVLREGLRAIGILLRKRRTIKQALRAIASGIVISTRNEHSLLLSKYGQPDVIKIAQLHHDHGFDPHLFRDLERRYTHIDALALLTDQTTQEIESMLSARQVPLHCVTIPNFITPVPTFSVAKRSQVLAAGRLHPDKDFASLLRIWAKVCPQFPQWHLKIVGDGPLRQELSDYIQTLGLESQTELSPAMPHEDLLKEMASSSIFALTSQSESFGLVLVEAMACGTPCVSFDIRVGPSAIFGNTKSGILIEQRDEIQFAEALAKLMASSQERERLGARARERAQHFTEDAVMTQWISLFQTCMHHHRKSEG
jgi:glycosyltransferase involved in cell wall biosynthesis